jgi:hypothetical protein
MDNQRRLSIAVSLSIFAAGFGWTAPSGATPTLQVAVATRNPAGMTPSRPAMTAIPAANQAPPPAYSQYTYYGDRYRDPFIPLTGEFRGDQGADRPPQVSSLLLKGIMQDAKGRIALLTSGISSYILRGGRLYDGRNHLMKGISGVIKTNSVVLMGSDRTVKELKVTQNL